LTGSKKCRCPTEDSVDHPIQAIPNQEDALWLAGGTGSIPENDGQVAEWAGRICKGLH